MSVLIFGRVVISDASADERLLRLARIRAGLDQETEKDNEKSLSDEVSSVVSKPAHGRKLHHYLPRDTSGYVGLFNQGATCYMNSLLQTLFMSPDFRRALFAYRYDPEKDGPEDRSIPLQLQHLFARLLLSDRKAISTKALTCSFGWDERGGFEQHDVQELNRVLFSALERSFRGTDQEHALRDLYQGELYDRLSCQGCNVPRGRKDQYEDIPLVVRKMHHMYASLEKYIEREVIEGVQCESCGEAHPHWKGLELQTVPKYLTIQLKRFDIDFTTFQRVKVNDRFGFPKTLVMDDVLKASTTAKEAEDAEEEWEDHEVDVQGKDHVYELFSVMIHSGTALAGHYYAYVKALDQDNPVWYKFNDASVTVMEDPEASLKDAFGGAASNSRYARSASAYMLVYRKVESQSPAPEDKTLLPDDLVKIIQAENEIISEWREAYMKVKDDISIRVFLDTQAPEDENMVKIKVRGDESLTANTQRVHEALDIEVPLECIRVRNYSNLHSVPTDDWWGQEEKTLHELGVRKQDIWMIEQRANPDIPWRKYDPSELLVHVHVWADHPLDEATDGFEDHDRYFQPSFDVYISKKETFRTFKERVSAEIGWDPDTMRVYEFLHFTASELQGDQERFGKDLNMVHGDDVYIEQVVDDTSPILTYYERRKNLIRLSFNDPADETVDMSREVCMDKHATCEALTQKIGTALGLDPSTFFLSHWNRFSARSNVLKNPTATLSASALGSASQILVTMGTPMAIGEFKATVLRVASGSDHGPSFLPLGHIVFREEELFSKVETRIATLLAEEDASPPDPRTFRVREVYRDVLGDIYHPTLSMSDNCSRRLTDDLILAVEPLASPQDWPEGSILTHIRVWDPSTQTMSEPTVYVVHEDDCMGELCDTWAKEHGLPRESMQIAHPWTSSMEPASIARLYWRGFLPDTKESPSVHYAHVKPDYERTFGNVYRQFTDGEDIYLRNVNLEPKQTATPMGPYKATRPRRKEKALVIHNWLEEKEKEEEEETPLQ